MPKTIVEIIQIDHNIQIYGLSTNTIDKSLPKDIPRLSKEYHHILNKKENEILPFYVVTKDYNPKVKTSTLFIGGIIPHPNLTSLSLPNGTYAKIVIKPKFKRLWGLSIIKAKQYFYTQWLENNPYAALNLEYEYHTENSISEKPSITLLFSIKSHQ